jgi:parallel beta-helix repeat protein
MVLILAISPFFHRSSLDYYITNHEPTLRDPLGGVTSETSLGDAIYAPTNHTAIQEAVDAAHPGDIIYVKAGTYVEHVVVNIDNIGLLAEDVNNTIIDGGGSGTALQIEANNVTVSGFVVKNSNTGIYLQEASDCSILNNFVTLNKFGIMLSFSTNCCIRTNIATNNEYNIRLGYSSNNNLTDNSLQGNRYNFGVYGSSLEHFVHSIDDSNTANGKPIYYIINAENLVVSPQTYFNPGCIIVVNSSKIVVKDLTISNNLDSILLAYTSESTVENVITINNKIGIDLHHCSNCTVSGSIAIYNMYHGILLSGSSQCEVYGNNLTSNTDGIYITYSNSCSVHGNTLYNNEIGIRLDYAFDNVVFHNNILSNAKQVYYSDSLTNRFDNGFEGNYWIDYSGVDLDTNGIGDASYEIDESTADHFPLMGMFQSFETSLGYHVDVISNSTIENFEYQKPNGTIKIVASNTAPDQTHGFCRLAIPHSLVSPPYQVTINNASVTYVTAYENETLSIICFNYQHSTLEIIITIEFQTFVMTSVLIMATLLIIAYRRKYSIGSQDSRKEQGLPATH